MESSVLGDRLDRPLRDLRISVTDRCNFRCVYCMPREIFGRDYAFLPRSEVLTFEEIARLAGVLVELGVEKLRVTGGDFQSLIVLRTGPRRVLPIQQGGKEILCRGGPHTFRLRRWCVEFRVKPRLKS